MPLYLFLVLNVIFDWTHLSTYYSSRSIPMLSSQYRFLCVLFWYHQVACKWICLTPFLVHTCLHIWKYIIWILYTLSEIDLVIQNQGCTINVLNFWSISNYVIIRITRCQIMDCKSRMLKAEKLWQIQGCLVFSHSHLTECIGCHIFGSLLRVDDHYQKIVT
jgi:hypothetical protein